jgi:hypothetical protein
MGLCLRIRVPGEMDEVPEMVEEAKEAMEKVAEAFGIGYEIGTEIDKATGASDVISTAAVDVNPERAVSASNDWDNANANWDKGEYVDAVGDGASAVGKFAESVGEAAWDKVTDIFD